MKLKKFKTNHKLLELYLLKLRTYEQYDKKLKNVVTSNLDQSLIYFKKALKIIFKFHTKNKKILFLGLRGLILKKINKNTNHVAMPPKTKLKSTFFGKTKFKNSSKYSLLKLKKNPKLVIILDKIDHYVSFVDEIHAAKIPIITFGKSLIFKKNALQYNVPATTEFLVQNKNLFCNCLRFLFKKPKLIVIEPKPTKFKRTKKNYVKYEKKKI